MKNSIITLYDFRVKRYALLLALSLFILDCILPHIFVVKAGVSHQGLTFHYGILMLLITAINSKDKVDDELSMRIRYSLLKLTLTFIIGILGIAAILFSRAPMLQLSSRIILFILEGLLLVHIILYSYGVRHTPKWLLNEEAGSPLYNNSTLVVLTIFTLAIIGINLLQIS